MDETPRMALDPMPSTHRFIVAGISLRTCFAKLKPACPRKKDIPHTKVLLSGVPNKVTCALAGAAVGMPALVGGGFIAEIPFLEFSIIASDHFEDGELLTFEVAPGRISICGVASYSPDVHVRSAALDQAGEVPPANPLDGGVGALLLPAYAHMRRYGMQLTVADRVLAQQQREVDRILTKVDRLLSPLGLRRPDIEHILDRRVKDGA